ncbi:MAG: response regulator [Bacteroidia bacterium]|nr:response regulator [Bacteroidia bacterium]
MNSRKLILIVDDDIDFISQIKHYCEKFGYETMTANSENEALELIKTRKPDLAMLDLMMEKDDSGFILSYKIKQKYPDVPVIIATAVTSETGLIFGVESHEEQQWIKADLIMEKGVRPDQLQREIKRLLKE